MVVWRNNELLLIERKKQPFGFAPPAGHVDHGESFEAAARRELQEEVGLTAESCLLLREGRKENPCRRPGGSWHYWQIFQMTVSGQLQRSEGETKRVGYYGPADLRALAVKTEQYLRQEITQDDWEKSPGLEPVWYEWLRELEIIT